MSLGESGEEYASRTVQHKMEFPFGTGTKPSFGIKTDPSNSNHTIVSLYLKLEKQLTSSSEDSLFDLDILT
jgi:hypothetical protein